jgi:hypothetical protein
MPNLDLNALKDPTVSNAQFVSELFPEKNSEENENEDENENETRISVSEAARIVRDIKDRLDKASSSRPGLLLLQLLKHRKQLIKLQ